VTTITLKPMTNYKALCVELADALHGHTSLYRGHECELVTRARAALAQPEPVGVTDEELLCIDDLRNAWNAQADAANSWDELGIDEIVWFAQQQALTRWGHPTIKPVPVAGEVRASVVELQVGVEFLDNEGLVVIANYLRRAIALLERLSTSTNQEGYE